MTLSTDAATRKDKTTKTELQHRHFAFIAAVIASMPDHAPSLRAQKASCATAFADACQGSNPRFERARFMRACGE